MNCYIISYDLNKGDKNDYSELYKVIKSISDRIEELENTKQ